MQAINDQPEFELRKRYQHTLTLENVRNRLVFAIVMDPVRIYSCGDTNEQIRAVQQGISKPSPALLKALHLEKWGDGYRIPLSDFEGCTEMLKRVRRPRQASSRKVTKSISVQF